MHQLPPSSPATARLLGTLLCASLPQRDVETQYRIEARAQALLPCPAPLKYQGCLQSQPRLQSSLAHSSMQPLDGPWTPVASSCWHSSTRTFWLPAMRQ